jgi:AcrR family transcriptional regulator
MKSKQPYHHGALREALLEAAETILVRDGIAALTLRATARQAGVSHAAPTYHFGDLTGLLTELAASGFVRFKEHMQLLYKVAGENPQTRLIALGRGYVGFASAHPELFLLMFRSERLDWSSPNLSKAGPAAFALLTEDVQSVEGSNDDAGFQNLVTATRRWSLMHGLATLLVDGRLVPTSQLVPGGDVDKLIAQVLSQGLS